MNEDKNMNSKVNESQELRLVIDKRIHWAMKQHAAFRRITLKQWVLEAAAAKMDEEDSRQ